jgi:hypothetical protein
MIARAVNTQGILEEDRLAYLNDAHELAIVGANRYPHNKLILSAYGDLGIEFYRLTGKYDYYDEAIAELKKAEAYDGDPDISSMIIRLDRRIAGHYAEPEVAPVEET